nr:MAG TPA: hypothetical protein [Caudoviricetes sp.]
MEFWCQRSVIRRVLERVGRWNNWYTGGKLTPLWNF